MSTVKSYYADVTGECYDCKHLDSAWVTTTATGSDPHRSFCPNGMLAGLHVDGCFSEYFCALAKNTAKVSARMQWEAAAPMTCAGITIYVAIRKAGLKPGQVVAISGLGALGHIGVQIAKAMVSGEHKETD